MRPYTYETAADPEDAARRASRPGAMIYAGGTTMLDLMKLGVYQPEHVVDITRMQGDSLRAIRERGGFLQLGALVTMHEAAENDLVKRRAPVVSESLWLAASQQLRHMATLGGNVLQRTRDPYFRDPSWQAVISRNDPRDSGEPEGANRLGAVLGTTPDFCASYPGDFAQSLVAFDTIVEIQGPTEARRMAFADLHVLPSERSRPDEVTRLAPGEVITSFLVPITPALARSTYTKVRDRDSYAFANASCAGGIEFEGDGRTVRDVRLGLGGVATVPWRARDAEDFLRGRVLTPDTARQTGEAAFASARTFHHNAFKVPLGADTIAKTLITLQTLGA